MYTRGLDEVPNPDPDAGLYIKNRAGEEVKASIPTDHIAFQMGECMQVWLWILLVISFLSKACLMTLPEALPASCYPENS